MFKIIKRLSLILLFLGIIVITWAAIPEVRKVELESGVSFTRAQSWNQDSIQALVNYISTAEHVDAFIALEKDKEIFSYGAIDRLINLHSARKPIISLLIGIAQDKGLLNINETLGEMGIGENGVELTETEKSASIRDLLMARSGIYLDADAQPEMATERPSRGQYRPGEFYYYNNFDFNALGTILNVKTGMSYEECLYEWLALPLEMQEFRSENVVYGTPFSSIDTQHPAYKTWMSARDLAKIGSMMAQKGMWKGKRIVSESWILESTTPYHRFAEENANWPKTAFGYLWAVDTENNNIWGSGYGGQHLMVDTTNQLVLVQRHFTGNSLLSQGIYLTKNTQSATVDLMQVWYGLLRSINH